MTYMERWLGSLPSKRVVETLPITMATDDVGLGETDPRAVFTADGRRWWAKFAAAHPGHHSLAVEHIVGRLGSLIGAPVCEVAVLQPSDDLVADLGPELAHGSLDVGGAAERAMEARPSRRRRQSGSGGRNTGAVRLVLRV